MNDFVISPDTTLGPVALVVSDLARALRFYSDTLGLETLQAQGDSVSLGAEDSAPLVVLEEKQGARPKPRHSTGLYHFAILLPSRVDLARILRRFAERRYPLQGAADHGVSEALYLGDPDGNGIEIYSDKSRDLWPWQDGQLTMGTEALDVDGLLSLDNGYWHGPPRETRIGHVHLHVSDLGQAQSFYCDTLGFDLIQRYGQSALFVSAGGYHHHIGLNTWAGVGAPPPPQDAVGLRHFTVHLPDEAELERMSKHLEVKGVSIARTESVGKAAGAFMVNDPSGNGILMDVP